VSLFSLMVQSVWAHPLDISSTVITLGEYNLGGTTYFHSYEVGAMLGRQGKDVTEVWMYNEYRNEIIEYFRTHFSLRNNSIPCDITSVDIPIKEWYEILSRWVEINFNIVCPEKLDALDFSLEFFTDFPLQTNRLSLLDEWWEELYFKVGTQQIQTLSYTVGAHIERIDTDHDGIDDEEEHVYKTDPKNRDSDGDYYLDGEEVNYGWLPMNPSPSPGQIQRWAYPETFLITPPRGIDQSQPKKDYSLLANTAAGDVFQSLLKKIGMTVSWEEKTAFPLIFLFTVLLGFLHALGPGHAKWLLSGIMVHKKSSFFSGLRFILIFSLTHILDIFLLYLLLQFFLHIFDTNLLLTWIQQWSAVILLFLGFFLVYRAFRGKLDESGEEFTNGKITLLAIIAGLAPCSFGWSLFFMLISLGKMNWIPPLIFAIALGIFLCLFLILLLLTYTKKHSYSRFSGLSKYSVRFSAILILCIGLYFTKMNFLL
jgi:ABC-type nickel/cobalt efflux system permease component RcnA